MVTRPIPALLHAIVTLGRNLKANCDRLYGIRTCPFRGASGAILRGASGALRFPLDKRFCGASGAFVSRRDSAGLLQ